MTIFDIYTEKSKKISDINEHLPVLYQYSLLCDYITEFGSRSFISTWAFLAARPKKLVSYDIKTHKNLKKVLEKCKNENIEFQFFCKDVLKTIIESTDMLFIDTWHVYDQLIQELTLHSDKVNKYIIMHDTETFGENGESDKYSAKKRIKKYKGLHFAIKEFLERNRHWAIKEILKTNNGLTILERQSII